MAIDEDLLYQLVAERLKRARGAAGLSQERLATKLGMSRTSIVNIEAGRQRPPLHVLWEMAEHLGTELRLLIPRRAEYQENGAPLELDADTVEKIEEAASGDPATRRDLTDFISRAVSRTEDS